MSALYVDSLVNGFPLSPLVVQSCRDFRGRGVLRLLGGWRRVEVVVAFAEDRLRLPVGFVFYGEAWGGEVGIDVGVRDFLTLSTGERINCPDRLRQLGGRLGGSGVSCLVG